MSEALTILAAVMAAIVLIVAIVRIAGWITDQKSGSDFKKERPDGTNVNDGGFMF